MIAIAGEGATDLVVMRRLLRDLGITDPTPYWGEGRRTGKDGMDRCLAGWAAAAARAPWFVLRDLDGDAACAGALRAALVPAPPPGLCFRIAVRQTEAWLLADRERFADALGVPVARLPDAPDGLADAKAKVVDLARRSRRRAVLDIVPREGSGRATGPGYLDFITDFAQTRWQPQAAQARSDSLRRALAHLARWRPAPS